MVSTHYLLCIRHMALLQKIYNRMNKLEKMEVPCGSLQDANLKSILDASGVPLGSLGASYWEKGAFQNGSKKWLEKRSRREFRGTMRMTPGAPVDPYNILIPQAPGAQGHVGLGLLKTKAPDTPLRASGHGGG